MSRREGMLVLLLNLLLMSALLTGGLFPGGSIPLHDHTNANSGGVLTVGQGYPVGATMLIDSGTCPTGFTELTALRGRYTVGVPSGGTIAATTGTALTNSENRPAGAHTHVVSGGNGTAGALITFGSLVGTAPTSTTDNGGLVAGTNSPFYQVMFCKKT